MTASQVNEMMARERAFTRVAASANLTEDQFRVVEDTFRAVNPPDPAAWASGFLGAMGIGKKNPTNPAPNAATQATKPSPSNTPPARVAPDLGSPAPGDQRDAEAVLLNRPLEANLHDFERLVVQHGRTKALEMWSSHVKAYLGGVRVVPDNRRQR